jgi:KDO2-lipid IV(A) lauroyltransferase
MRPLGRCLGWLAGSVLRVRRAHALEAIARAGVPGSRRVAREMYASLGATVAELLWMGGRPGARLGELVEVDERQWASVRRALSLGRGLVVATAHTGNWDLAACAMAERVRLTVITKRLGWRAADAFWQGERAARGVRLVGAHGAVGESAAALAAGGAVAFIVDQAPPRRTGVETFDFLGAPALHDLSFALVAARRGAPVVLAFDERLADGRHRVHVPLVIEPPRRATRAWARRASRQVNEALEGFVRRRPAQWLWLHRRWKGVS